MATVRKRTWQSSGIQRTAWVADYADQAGKRHLKTFDTKKAADAWLVTTRHSVAQGTHTPDSASTTVAEAAEIWLAQGRLHRLERSTLAKYQNHVDRHVVPLLGPVRLARLTKPMVEQFRDDMLGRASWAMARKVVASLKAILGEAQRRSLVAQNVAQQVKIDARRREKRKLMVGQDIPEKLEVAAMLKAATGRWRPLLVTAVFCGMRASELRGLAWADVDFARKEIHVRQRADQWGEIGSPKSSAGHRAIPMSPMVVQVLREWRLVCPRHGAHEGNPGRLSLVFPNGEGNPESHSNIVGRGLGPVQVAAGVTVPHPTARDEEGRPVLVAKYGMHALRHFFASWAIEQGFTPKRIQALLGHASIQMTFDTYGHLFPNPEDDQARFAAAERDILPAEVLAT
ncbi:MAG TPA: site-specific integrase [Aquabacterium sp.]|nr:site-specific integrase [Aquabacterium sp.]